MPRTIDDVATVQQGLSTFGRGAGARPGSWMLNVVESRDIGDQCWLDLRDLREVGVAQSPRIERHLLRPYDVLVTARAAAVQSALVPPEVSRTVAGSTVLVIRTNNPEWGMGHYLWYFLASTYGQREIAKRLSTAATITSLSAANLGEIQLQVPSMQELDQVARIVEASEEAYALEMEAARLRRETVRDAIISIMGAMPAPANEEESCRSLAKN